MRIADVMREDFITVAPEDTLGEVARRMVDKTMGAVIVKDFGRLIGILTERDLLKAMAARVHTCEARVRQWMTPDPITITPGRAARRGRADHARQQLPPPARDGGHARWSATSACGVSSARSSPPPSPRSDPLSGLGQDS